MSPLIPLLLQIHSFPAFDHELLAKLWEVILLISMPCLLRLDFEWLWGYLLSCMFVTYCCTYAWCSWLNRQWRNWLRVGTCADHCCNQLHHYQGSMVDADSQERKSKGRVRVRQICKELSCVPLATCIRFVSMCTWYHNMHVIGCDVP